MCVQCVDFLRNVFQCPYIHAVNQCFLYQPPELAHFCAVCLQKNTVEKNHNCPSTVPNYTEPHFNLAMLTMLRARGLDVEFVPCALGRPIQSSRWHINVPDIAKERWNRRNFRLVVHAQDFVHFFGDLCVELHWLEQQFSAEQQSKIIFVCWDHGLEKIYQGNIKIVNFASHSYELVHQLKSRWSEWKTVHNTHIRHNWLCLNGRARQYRQEVYNMLRHEPSGLVSHSIFNPLQPHPYQDYNFNNVDNFVKLLPVYRSARSSVVTESLYQDVGGIVTEKTLLAMAAGHPLMCIGHRHCHRDIESLGFENYHELFDLSYDSEIKDTRMYSAIQKNINTLRWPLDLDAVQEKIHRNFEWLMGGYADSIRARAEKDLAVLFEKRF